MSGLDFTVSFDQYRSSIFLLIIYFLQLLILNAISFKYFCFSTVLVDSKSFIHNFGKIFINICYFLDNGIDSITS